MWEEKLWGITMSLNWFKTKIKEERKERRRGWGKEGGSKGGEEGEETINWNSKGVMKWFAKCCN
jgi:hypothetical protein